MDCKILVALGSAVMSRQTAAARNKHAALLGPPPRRALHATPHTTPALGCIRHRSAQTCLYAASRVCSTVMRCVEEEPPACRGHGRTAHSMLFAALPRRRRPRAAQRAQRSATALAPVSPQKKTQSQDHHISTSQSIHFQPVSSQHTLLYTQPSLLPCCSRSLHFESSRVLPCSSAHSFAGASRVQIDKSVL